MTPAGIGRARTPWHLWLVGAVAALMNGFGCFDYTMTQLKGDAWLANMDLTETQLAWFHGMPAWVDAAWAVGVWGGLLGAILLLLRRKWAVHAFAASFLGWAAGAVYAFALSNGMEVMGPWWPIQIVHGVLGAVFIWYAMTMSKKGVLR
ncbi:hypothetical protein GGQ87_003011 [Brevundimonas alba]|uniref:Uncharacterized protein n=1 Tax=Brevundimonas alba TaxID=74314 RepID=A0A7X5YML7_9CAUL|nr:hypothetical protein [Brevundimonas alba]NJC42716.1 hypothetical protein [Brevundimonas alba]